jgi:hypothetical protein
LDLLLLRLLLLLCLLLWFCPVFDIQRERTIFRRREEERELSGIVLFLLSEKKYQYLRCQKSVH